MRKFDRNFIFISTIENKLTERSNSLSSPISFGFCMSHTRCHSQQIMLCECNRELPTSFVKMDGKHYLYQSPMLKSGTACFLTPVAKKDNCGILIQKSKKCP